jgi:hypothetical protein
MPIEMGQVEAIFRYPVKSSAANDLRKPRWAGTTWKVTGGFRSGGWMTAAVPVANRKQAA